MLTERGEALYACANCGGPCWPDEQHECPEAFQASCEHSSATGIDQATVTDPAKIWRCDECGLLHRWRARGDGTAGATELVPVAAGQDPLCWWQRGPCDMPAHRVLMSYSIAVANLDGPPRSAVAHEFECGCIKLRWLSPAGDSGGTDGQDSARPAGVVGAGDDEEPDAGQGDEADEGARQTPGARGEGAEGEEGGEGSARPQGRPSCEGSQGEEGGQEEGGGEAGSDDEDVPVIRPVSA